MCGICGEIRWDGQAADVGAVARMTGAMASRGPDGDGVMAHGRVALGHRRLSIIDLSARGAQPMVDSELGLTLVFNGCIYNYKELRSELQADRVPLLLDRRQRGRDQGLRQMGCPLRRPVQGNVRLRHRRPRLGRGDAGAGPAGHQAAVFGHLARPAAIRIHRASAARTPAAWTRNWTARRCTTT